MKTWIAVLAALALGAGPAAAQGGYGTFSPNGHPPPGAPKPRSLADVYGGLKPATPSPAPRPPQAPRSYDAPYGPPQPKTYGVPKPPKACEQSVFVDACKPGH